MLLNEIIILGFAFALFGLILFLGWRSDLPKSDAETILEAIENPPEPNDKLKKAVQEWRENEKQMNKRQDTIGQNGNNGDHYEL